MSTPSATEPTRTGPTSAPEPAAHGPSRRALRLMAAVRWLLLVLVTTAAAYVVWTSWGPASAGHEAGAPERYYCPMHPEVRSPDPGECPICHMDLEPIPAARQAARTSTAPAHPHPPEVVDVVLTDAQQRLIGLTTEVVSAGGGALSLRLPARVVAPETGVSEVRVRVAGFVEEVLVRQTGARVARGQVLAWVSSPELQRAQGELLAALSWPDTRPEVVRAARRGLELLGMSADDVEALVTTRQPQPRQALRATEAGVVTRVSVVPGGRVEPEQAAYTLADLSTVWAVVSVDEAALRALAVGTPADFVPGEDTSGRVRGRVVLIDPLLDEVTRTVQVRVALPNPRGALRPGQYGEVELRAVSPAGVWVPRDAVIRTGQHTYVYVAQGEQLSPRSVRVGAQHGGRVPVLEGLAAGEVVVSRGGFVLDSESRLQASLAAAPSVSPTAAPSVSPAAAPPGTGASSQPAVTSPPPSAHGDHR